jgi:cytochrome c1
MLELKRQTIGADAQDLQMARAKHRADGRHGYARRMAAAPVSRPPMGLPAALSST